MGSCIRRWEQFLLEKTWRKGLEIKSHLTDALTQQTDGRPWSLVAMAARAAVLSARVREHSATLRTREAVVSTPPAPLQTWPLGHVVLRPTTGRCSPKTTANLVRIQILPDHARDKVSPATIPVALKLAFEPGMGLLERPEIIVTKAVSVDGRHLEPELFPDEKLGACCCLHTPAGQSVTSLKHLQGVIRAKVYRNRVVTLPFPAPGGEWATAKGPSGSELRVRCLKEWLETEVAYPRVGVTRLMSGEYELSMRADKVIVTDTDGLDFHVEPIEQRFPDGVPWWDANGVVYPSLFSVHRQVHIGRRPAKLTYIVRELRQIELPFKLTDVPVAAGTRDPKAAIEPPARAVPTELE